MTDAALAIHRTQTGPVFASQVPVAVSWVIHVVLLSARRQPVLISPGLTLVIGLKGGPGKNGENPELRL